MKFLDLSNDVLRQIMIHYIDNSEVNKIKIKFIGSKQLNIVNNDIHINIPNLFQAKKLINKFTDKIDTHIFDVSYKICGTDIQMTDIYMYVRKDLVSDETLIGITAYIDIHNTGILSKMNINISDIIISNCDRATTFNYVNLTTIMHVNNEYECKYVDGNGDTSLTYACRNYYNDVALVLLEFDCVPYQVNRDGQTALSYARLNGIKDVVKKLEDLGLK